MQLSEEVDFTQIPTSALLKALCGRFDALVCAGTYIDEDNKENFEFCFHGSLTTCFGLVHRSEDNLYFESDNEDDEEMGASGGDDDE